MYREMLTQAWRRGARLPNDPEAIRRVIGATMREWTRCWPKIATFWRVDGDFLVNDTQLEIYAEARARRDKASERGRKGAEGLHRRQTAQTVQTERELELEQQLEQALNEIHSNARTPH